MKINQSAYTTLQFPVISGAALMLLLTPAFTYLIATLGFILGLPVAPWQFPLSCILAIFTVGMLNRKNRRQRTGSLKGAIVASAATAILIPVCGLLSDFSFDGNHYHQEIIVYLLNGWNPASTLVPAPKCTLWAMHYLKALEIMQACAVSSTGYIETGKIINLMIIFGVGFSSYIFIRNFLTSLSRKLAIIATLVLTLNPVGICQALTFYIDNSGYYLMLLVIIASADLARGISLRSAMALILLIMVAAGIKFTTFFYTGVGIGMVLIWIIYQHFSTKSSPTVANSQFSRKIWSIIGISALGALLGVTLTGFHPYITNTLSQGNPLYPLVGNGAVDIMTSNTPAELNCNRLLAFWRSITAVRIPSVSSDMGGFGPFMLLLLCLSAISLIFTRSPHKGVLRYFAIFALLSCFIFQQAWWARYVPQLWLVPAVGFIAATGIPGKGLRRTILSLTAFCTLLTALMSAGRALVATSRITILRCAIYREFRHQPQPLKVLKLTPSMQRHFEEQNLTIVEIDDEDASPRCRAVGFYGIRKNGRTPRVILNEGMQLSDFGLNKGLPRKMGLNAFLFDEGEVFPIAPGEWD